MTSDENSAGNTFAERLKSVFTSAIPAADARMSDDETSIVELRAGISIAIVFLVIYFAHDLWFRREELYFGGIFHWISVIATMAFLGATFTRAFRTFWRLWILLFFILLITILTIISAETNDGDSRYIALLLYPVATAAFVNWEWRWQALMGLSCLALYGLAEFFVPLSGATSYRWFGLFAAVALAECISFFIGVYRQRIDAQVDQLKQAAAFRESQIATMAHDIRSPVAAIAGFVELLEDEELEDEDRMAILERIGTTAWLMDLTVSNVLDLYQISGGRLSASPARVDPNRIVGNAASNCATQAIHKGLRLTVDYGNVPPGNFDPRHLERIARNMLAYSIARSSSGEIRLRTSAYNRGIVIEVEDDGPLPSDDEIATWRNSSAANGTHPAKTIGLYVARSLAETSGGQVKLTFPNGTGIRLTAEVPSATSESKPHAT